MHKGIQQLQNGATNVVSYRRLFIVNDLYLLFVRWHSSHFQAAALVRANVWVPAPDCMLRSSFFARRPGPNDWAWLPAQVSVASHGAYACRPGVDSRIQGCSRGHWACGMGVGVASQSWALRPAQRGNHFLIFSGSQILEGHSAETGFSLPNVKIWSKEVVILLAYHHLLQISSNG